MGFGHRVYKSYDPRAKLIKRVADDVFEQTGLNPKLEIALELERIALEDEYFVSRRLYPNVDFYSGLIYQAMGYPTDYFTVLFALGRLPGWIAQWEEHLSDPEQKISRPRQIYTGEGERPYVPWRSAIRELATARSSRSPRRRVGARRAGARLKLVAHGRLDLRPRRDLAEPGACGEHHRVRRRRARRRPEARVDRVEPRSRGGRSSSARRSPSR